LLALATLVLLLDQASKAWIRANIPLGNEMPLLPGVVHLSHVLNYGAAWGVLQGQRVLLVVVSLVVLGSVLYSARSIVARGPLMVMAMGFVLGGALGNLIDRIWQGAVTDMIDVDTSIGFLRAFPVFNIADSALTVGVTLLCIYLLFNREPETASST
jgi:signal peptidase II